MGSAGRIFAWHKRELGPYSIRKHSIDTQGLPPYHMTLGRLSYWEEVEVNRQIQTLVDLGKMHKSALEYACRVTFPMKKDGSQNFCGNYYPLNFQTRRDSFPMPLIEDVLNQWFSTLDCS